MPRDKKSTMRFCNPFTVKCLYCSEYIFKNKRHNAYQEEIKGGDYYGIKVYRFMFKCTGCKKMLSIKTDPKNGDYQAENGCLRIDNLKKEANIRKKENETDIEKIKEEIKKLYEIEKSYKK
ncbi:splicing factor YJU2 (YJU2) [Vairimorpha necatrix]|uniref:Splicing factor YJU2 (YJU2) n=1 Tax=Vairimorpha necatrix TaxID=6039 RepID=A0AAX4JDZ6_9MICR